MEDNEKRFINKVAISVGVVAILFLIYRPEIQAADEPKHVEKGIKFNVPPDWPIEEKSGGLAPMPVEEYVIKRFKEIEGRLEELQKLQKSLAEKTQPVVDPKFQNDIASKLDIINAQLKAISDSAQTLRADMQELKDNRSKINGRLDEMDKEQAQIKKLLRDLEDRVEFLKFHMKI